MVASCPVGSVEYDGGDVTQRVLESVLVPPAVVAQGRAEPQRVDRRDGPAQRVVHRRGALVEGIDRRLWMAVGIVDGRRPPVERVDDGDLPVHRVADVGGDGPQAVSRRCQLAARVVRARRPEPQRD